jgi:uroporphyrinogen-III synthase
MRVIVTRPAAQAGPWIAALQARRHDAVALPLIEIGPVASAADIDAAWQGLSTQALVFFVSANAVLHFFAHRPAHTPWPAATLAAAPGPGTAQALRAQGLPEACVVGPAPDAPTFDSEALWARLAGRDWHDASVLIVRGEQGRDWLADQLQAAGARTSYLAAYRRLPPTPDDAGRRLLAAARADPAGHLWLFSSSEAVRHLAALWRVPPGARALASHPRIAAAARAAGFGFVDEASPTLEATLAAVDAQVGGKSAR